MKEKPIIDKPYAVGIAYSRGKTEIMLGYYFGERSTDGLVMVCDPQDTLEDLAIQVHLAYTDGRLETIEGVKKGHFPISKVEYSDSVLRNLRLGKGIYLGGLTSTEFSDFKEKIRNYVKILEIWDKETDKACVIGDPAPIQGRLGRDLGYEQQINVRGPLGELLLNPGF